jgi:hypothetical protein
MRAVPQISALVLLVKLHSCARAGESSPRVGDDAAGSSTALHGIQLVVTPAEETSIVQAWDPNTGERERERECVARRCMVSSWWSRPPRRRPSYRRGIQTPVSESERESV